MVCLPGILPHNFRNAQVRITVAIISNMAFSFFSVAKIMKKWTLGGLSRLFHFSPNCALSISSIYTFSDGICMVPRL